MSDNYLPSEIVLEILHKLPVKSLVKFTSVCRAWNSLITDRTFISDHLNRTLIQASNGHNGYLFFQFCLESNLRWCDTPREYSYSLYSTTNNQQTDNHFSVERLPLPFLFFPLDRSLWFAGGTCNGLVSSAYYSPSSGSITILIWNPLLRKYVVLPKPVMTRNKHVYTRCFGLGFDSMNNDYKVVVLMQFASRQHTDHLEVYSLVSRSWRSITISVPKFYLETGCPPVFVNGAMHCVVCRKKDGSIQRSILSFDVTEETFGELTLPLQSNEEFITTSRLLVVEGGRSLAVVIHPRKRTIYLLHIWVMKEYGVTDSWTEIFHCDARRYGCSLDVLALTTNGKGIMRRLDGAIVLVDPTKESMEPMGLHKTDAAYAGSFVESLFFINNEFDALSF